LFSFNIPAVTDVALAILTLAGLAELVRKGGAGWSRPIGLAIGWSAFVLVSAIYATALDFPGRHFGSVGKHLPLALGPFVAISLNATRQRVGVNINDLLTFFLAGLVVGAALMLLRNGAIGALTGLETQADNSMFGAVNRNFAGLACGLLIIASAGLLLQQIPRLRTRPVAGTTVIAALILSIGAASLLLGLVQSRTALIATIFSALVWLIIVVISAVRIRMDAPRAKLFVLIGPLVFAALAVVSILIFQKLSERPLMQGAPAEFAAAVPAILSGRLGDVASRLSGIESRLQLLAVALDLISQRPWLGWGPDVSWLIAAASPFPSLRELNQFHNGYIEAIVSFGILGALVLLALLMAVVWSAVAACGHRSRSDTLAPVLFGTAVALVVYVAVTNGTETILFVKPCAVVCVILTALACLPAGRARKTQKKPAVSRPEGL
jgi:O-antigen ligase